MFQVGIPPLKLAADRLGEPFGGGPKEQLFLVVGGMKRRRIDVVIGDRRVCGDRLDPGLAAPPVADVKIRGLDRLAGGLHEGGSGRYEISQRRREHKNPLLRLQTVPHPASARLSEARNGLTSPLRLAG